MSDLAQAYGFFSSGLQSSEPFTSWAEGYKSTVGVQVVEVRAEGDNTVYVKVRAVDLMGEELLLRIFVGTWQLVLEGAEWKLDKGDLREIERETFTAAASRAASFWGSFDFSNELEAASPEVRAAILAACNDIGLLWAPVSQALRQVTDLWEYGKLAALSNLANQWWLEACPTKANFGWFVPLPPLSLVEQLRTNKYSTGECGAMATQLEGLYLRIAREPLSRVEIQEMDRLLVRPQEEQWYRECDDGAVNG